MLNYLTGETTSRRAALCIGGIVEHALRTGHVHLEEIAHSIRVVLRVEHGLRLRCVQLLLRLGIFARQAYGWRRIGLAHGRCRVADNLHLKCIFVSISSRNPLQRTTTSSAELFTLPPSISHCNEYLRSTSVCGAVLK